MEFTILLNAPLNEFVILKWQNSLKVIIGSHFKIDNETLDEKKKKNLIDGGGWV